MFGLFRVVGIMRSAFGQRLAQEDWVHEAGIRPPTYAVLRTINAMQPASQKEVADRVGLYPSDLVAMVDQLEELGWVERSRDPSDRRRYQLTVTDEGQEIVDRFNVIAREVEDEVLEPLDADLRIALAKAADQLIENHLNRVPLEAAAEHHAAHRRMHAASARGAGRNRRRR